jgi:hypothetical protein
MRTPRIEMTRSRVVIAVLATLASAIAGCGPTPDVPTNEHGMCFQQSYCGGNTLLGLPTRAQCHESGGKSWAGGNSNSCISFGFP